MGKVTYPTLYHKAKTGKVHEWSVKVEGDSFTVSYGTVDGEKTCTYTKTYPKNVGKANEVTAEEQAHKEAKALWVKKKRIKYSETIKGTESVDLRPMLAHDYTKNPEYLAFPCYVQPKLNGIRCVAKFANGEWALSSRTGKEFYCPTVTAALRVYMDDMEVYDGELYVHGWEFEKITSAVKKYKPESSSLQFHIFDTIEADKPFEDRHHHNPVNSDIIKFVPTYLCETMEQVEAHRAKFIEQGYEGIMLRNAGSSYEAGYRSRNLLKYKDFLDEEFEVVGWEVAKDGTVVWKCHCSAGDFGVRQTGTIESNTLTEKEMRARVGSKLTVKYQTKSKDGIPIFPVGLGFRIDG